MKTYNIVKFNKGTYIDARINGRLAQKHYCKTQKEIKAIIKMLEAEGYEESK